MSFSFFSLLSDDDFYRSMKCHAEGIGPGSGRGRPPALPTDSGCTITNRLLLQLGMLRHQMQMSWVWLEDMAGKLLPQNFRKVLPQLNNLILKTERKVPQSSSFDDIDTFLSIERDFTNLPNAPFCSKYGVTRPFLLGKEDCLLPTSDEVVPKGLIIELDKFKTENYLSGSAIQSWLQTICPSCQLSTKELIQKISLLEVKYKKHLKARARRPEELEHFFVENFIPMQFQLREKEQVIESADGALHLSSTLTSSTPLNTTALCNNHCTSELQKMENDNLRLTSEVQQKDRQLQHHQDELEAMKEISVNQHTTISHLNKSLADTSEDLKLTAASLQSKEQKLAKRTKTCTILAQNTNNMKTRKAAIDRLRVETDRQRREYKRASESPHYGRRKQKASEKF